MSTLAGASPADGAPGARGYGDAVAVENRLAEAHFAATAPQPLVAPVLDDGMGEPGMHGDAGDEGGGKPRGACPGVSVDRVRGVGRTVAGHDFPCHGFG